MLSTLERHSAKNSLLSNGYFAKNRWYLDKCFCGKDK